jgi:hypothetical protein
MIADVSNTDREDLAWPHPVEHGHPENQPFTEIERLEREHNIFTAHHALLRWTLARRRIQPTRRIQINNTVTESHLENAAQVPPEVADDARRVRFCHFVEKRLHRASREIVHRSVPEGRQQVTSYRWLRCHPCRLLPFPAAYWEINILHVLLERVCSRLAGASIFV